MRITVGNGRVVEVRNDGLSDTLSQHDIIATDAVASFPTRNAVVERHPLAFRCRPAAVGSPRTNGARNPSAAEAPATRSSNSTSAAYAGMLTSLSQTATARWPPARCPVFQIGQ